MGGGGWGGQKGTLGRDGLSFFEIFLELGFSEGKQNFYQMFSKLHKNLLCNIGRKKQKVIKQSLTMTLSSMVKH